MSAQQGRLTFKQNVNDGIYVNPSLYLAISTMVLEVNVVVDVTRRKNVIFT